MKRGQTETTKKNTNPKLCCLVRNLDLLYFTMAVARRLNESFEAARQRPAISAGLVLASVDVNKHTDMDLTHIRTVLSHCVTSINAETFARNLPSNRYRKDRKFRCRKLLHDASVWYEVLTHEKTMESGGWWTAMSTSPVRSSNSSEPRSSEESRANFVCVNLIKRIKEWMLPLGPLVVALCQVALHKSMGRAQALQTPSIPMSSIRRVLKTVFAVSAALPNPSRQRITLDEWQRALVQAFHIDTLVAVATGHSLVSLLEETMTAVQSTAAAINSAKFRAAYDKAHLRFQHLLPIFYDKEKMAFQSKWNAKYTQHVGHVNQLRQAALATVRTIVEGAQPQAEVTPALMSELSDIDLQIRRNFYSVQVTRRARSTDHDDESDMPIAEIEAESDDDREVGFSNLCEASNPQERHSQESDDGQDLDDSDDCQASLSPPPRRSATALKQRATTSFTPHRHAQRSRYL